MNCNQTIICGEINKISELRYTPVGVAVAEFVLSHASNRIEAGISRKVKCEITAVAFAETAFLIAETQPGSQMQLTGFLVKKSQLSLQLILHVENAVQLLSE